MPMNKKNPTVYVYHMYSEIQIFKIFSQEQLA